jgi:hypothetical protein
MSTTVFRAAPVGAAISSTHGATLDVSASGMKKRHR